MLSLNYEMSMHRQALLMFELNARVARICLGPRAGNSISLAETCIKPKQEGDGEIQIYNGTVSYG